MYVHMTLVKQGLCLREKIIGPVEDVQLTSRFLRDEDGNELAYLGPDGLWHIDPGTNAGETYTDITFPRESPESLLES